MPQHVLLKLGDLAIQGVMLVQLMERGFPHTLVWTFTALISLNSGVCAVMIWLSCSSKHAVSGLHQVAVDTAYVRMRYFCVSRREYLLASCLF